MTAISYVDASWNPVRGCSPVSPGCDHCYAKSVAHRFQWGDEALTTRSGSAAEELAGGKKRGPVEWTGEVQLVPEALRKPLRWRQPRRVLVPTMGDLFHGAVPYEFAAAAFGAMAACPNSTFLVLTKRPGQMENWLEWYDSLPGPPPRMPGATRSFAAWKCLSEALHPDKPGLLDMDAARGVRATWPLPNVLLGTSVEDCHWADRRLPLLERIVRRGWRTWVSAEPLLGWLPDLSRAHFSPRHRRWYSSGHVEFIAVGAETGPGARRCDDGWVRRIVEQCADASIRCHVKQLSGGRKDPNAWPEELQARDWSSRKAIKLDRNPLEPMLRRQEESCQ